MSYRGDYRAADTIDFKFSTVATTGAPTTLAGSPAVSVYKSNSTTESTAGVTLTVDFDARTGLHHVRITTATDGTFYADGNDFDVIITAGTVGGVSVVGMIVGSFSIANRAALRPTTVGRTLDVAATGEAGLDFDNIKDASGSHTLTNIRVPNVTLADTVTTYTGNTPQTGDNFARIGAAGAGLTALGDTRIANLDGTVSSRASQASLDTVDDFLDTEVAAIKAKTDQLTFTTANKLDATIQAAADLAQAAADKVWSTTTRAITDKAGFSLSAGGVQAIWDALTSALTVVGSIGKKLADWTIGTAQTGDSFARIGAPAGASVSADIATRSSQASVDLVKAKTDNLPASPAATGDIPSAATVADAVWDEAIAGHLAAGSTGLALNSAGSAGDPWTTSLPGAYGAGSAGKILGDNLNATVGSRSSHSAADVWTSGTRTLSSFGTLVADIATAVWAAATRTLTAFGFTVSATADPNVALIKSKTDNLPAAPAAVGDIPTAIQNADAYLDRANAIETGVTPRQAQRIELAAAGGKLSGAATATVTIRNAQADSKDRIVATTDVNGNRTAVVLDLT